MFKRKDKNLWVEKYNGLTFYGKTQKEVINKIKEYKERDKSQLAKDVMEEWYEIKSEKVAPGRQRAIRGAVNRLAPLLGDRRVGEVRPVDLARVLTAASEGRKSETALLYRNTLRQTMRYAVSAGYIDIDPSTYIPTPTNTIPSERRNPPPDEEIPRILADTSYPFGLFAHIAIYTGLRKGEILALTKSDIDYDQRIIHVTKSNQDKYGKAYIKTPKTDFSNRIVSIPDALYPLLVDIPYDIVVSDEGKYFNAGRFAYGYRKWQKAIGITATPHQFRHLYTTAILDLGLEPHEAQLLLGHATVITTQRIYDHIRNERRLAAASKTRSLTY